MNENEFKLYIPDYYKSFRCKAGECTDTCCTAWEIDIDEETYSRYQEEAERLEAAGEDLEFAKKLRSCISHDECYHFNLEDREYCPFFTDEGLCEIQLKLGEECLCQICDDHPRFYDYYPDRKEAGVGICCEAACELVMFREDKTGFIEEAYSAEELLSEDMMADGDEELTEEEKAKEATLNALNAFAFDSRAALIEIVQNRELPLDVRVELCDKAAGHIQDMIEDALLFGDELSDPYEICEALTEAAMSDEESTSDGESIFSQLYKEDSLAELIELHTRAIPLKEDWHELMLELKEKLPELYANAEKLYADSSYLNMLHAPELRYEQLLVYFLFRYTCKSVYDGDLYTKVRFALDSVCMIHLIELYAFSRGVEIDKSELIRIASAYSKEIEYSEENMELFMY